MSDLATDQIFEAGDMVTPEALNAIMAQARILVAAITSRTALPDVSTSAETLVAVGSELRKASVEKIALAVLSATILNSITPRSTFSAADRFISSPTPDGTATALVPISAILQPMSRAVAQDAGSSLLAVDDAWGGAPDWAGTIRTVAFTAYAGQSVALFAAWEAQFSSGATTFDVRIIRDDGTVLKALAITPAASAKNLLVIGALDTAPGTSERTYRLQMKVATSDSGNAKGPILFAQAVVAAASEILPDDTGGSGTVATPGFSKSPSTLGAGGTLTITCATSGATIYYSRNGGSYVAYTAPFLIGTGETVDAYAIKSGVLNSDIATYDNAAAGGVLP